MSWLRHTYRKTITVFAVSVLMLTSISLAGTSANLAGVSAAAANQHASYSGEGLAESKVAVRGEQGPMLFIGGSMGISGEVFFGDMPVAPDPYAPESGHDDAASNEADGDGSADGKADDEGNADGNRDNTGATNEDPSDDSADNESEEDPLDNYLPPKPHGVTLPGIRQNLNLVIDGRLGESVQAYTRLSMSGVWGVSRPSDASPWMPSMVRPLLVDEAWVRYATDNFHVRAGKQRFSLGPIGLLGRTDLEAAEGVVADTGSDKWNLTGVWSRLSSGYYYNSSFVTRADNLLAFRVTWPVLDTWAFGLNYLADGLGDESGISVDLLGNIAGRNIAAELGMFESSSTLYPEYQTSGWVPGLVLKLEALNTPNHRLELSYGYLTRGFAPYFSSVASRSGGQTIPFDQNTQGVAVNYDRRLSPFTEINLKAANLRFLDNGAAHNEGSNGESGNEDESSREDDNKSGANENEKVGTTQTEALMAQSAITPVVLGSASIRHELKKNIFAEGEYEHWWMKSGSNYGRLTAGVTVNF